MTNPFSVLTLALATLVINVSQADACPRCGNPSCLGNGVMVQQPYFPGVRYPVQIGSQRMLGINQSGGIDTFNQQIDNTAFAFGRNQSLLNGSGRRVNRPVYDNFGRIVGYEQGMVWNNSITGQEHGNTQVVTPNGLGGVHLRGITYGIGSGLRSRGR